MYFFTNLSKSWQTEAIKRSSAAVVIAIPKSYRLRLNETVVFLLRLPDHDVYNWILKFKEILNVTIHIWGTNFGRVSLVTDLQLEKLF